MKQKITYEEPQLEVFQLETGSAVLNNVSKEKKNENPFEPII